MLPHKSPDHLCLTRSVRLCLSTQQTSDRVLFVNMKWYCVNHMTLTVNERLDFPSDQIWLALRTHVSILSSSCRYDVNCHFLCAAYAFQFQPLQITGTWKARQFFKMSNDCCELPILSWHLEFHCAELLDMNSIIRTRSPPRRFQGVIPVTMAGYAEKT